MIKRKGMYFIEKLLYPQDITFFKISVKNRWSHDQEDEGNNLLKLLSYSNDSFLIEIKVLWFIMNENTFCIKKKMSRAHIVFISTLLRNDVNSL